MQQILFLSTMSGSDWGGSEELWYQAALWTARNNYKTAVCCFEGKGKNEQLKELKQAGCRIYLLPGTNGKRNHSWLRKIKLFRDVAGVPFEKYDKVIVSQGGWEDVVHGPFKKLYKRLKTYILIYHNYNPAAVLPPKKILLLQRWSAKAEKNMGDTPKIFKTLKETSSLTISNTEKLYNPLTFETPQLPTAYPELKDGNYILSVFAALDAGRKAQDVLIRAMAHENWHNRNWELHLYGEGRDKELLQTLISELGMQSRIFLRGNAAIYKEAIRQSHLVLQITHQDAMPLTVMDSLAMARPLIASNIGAMPDWVKENINGWIVDEVNPVSVSKKLDQAWSQRNEWPAMGMRSFEILQNNFPDDPVEYFLKQTGIIQ